ncbi:MAG: tetratricopeptide repeat protein [Planctomycetes bacterium]|nr:tetratricopeptide repeat protein [Planctomycetota bacterium]
MKRGLPRALTARILWSGPRSLGTAALVVIALIWIRFQAATADTLTRPPTAPSPALAVKPEPRLAGQPTPGVAQPGQLPRPTTVDGYAPDRQCAACHRQLYNSYQHVGMARSFSRPRPDNIIEDFESNHYFHGPSKRHYEMIRRDDTFVMKRYQLDDTGRPINVLEQEIDWIIGSGSHSRGYLYHTKAGELYQLPIVWYTQSQSWGMAPGYDNPRHDGVTRLITRECMFCHNAYPQVPPGSDRYGQPHLFPRDLPQGTGCQRCHGPGAAHIRLANDLNVPLTKVVAAIVNPGRLAAPLRDDVCFQCHLQPTSKLTSLVRRFGRSDYSYRPGQPLSDYLVHLDFDDARDRSDRFEINHHPYRLRQSTCYTASDGALSCLTCHDPHRKVTPTEAAGYYRARCLTCHALDNCARVEMGIVSSSRPDQRGLDAAAGSDNCIACHMPKRRTQDVVHVVMTDHLIQRRITGDPLGRLAETPPRQGAQVKFYWPHRAPPAPTGSMYRAMSASADGDLSAIDALQALIAAASPQALEPYAELATAQLRAGRFDDALTTLGPVVQRDTGSAIALASAGVALAGLGRSGAAVETLSKAVELSPMAANTRYNLALTYARLGRTDQALQQYREALRLRPNYAQAWLNLGNALARQGQYREAADAFRQAWAIEPNLTPAGLNLGAALRYLGNWKEAVRVWRHGADLAPGHPGIALELALAYLIGADASIHDPAEGLRYARAATDAEPTAHQPVTALAVGLLLNDQADEAIATARLAEQLGADAPTCLLIMALAQHTSGDTQLAEETYQRARTALAQQPGDDRVRAALVEKSASVFVANPP